MQVISIGVDQDEILALQRLIDLVPKTEETAEFMLKVLPFLSNLHASYDEAMEIARSRQSPKRRTNKGEVEQLKAEVDKQRWQISGLMVQAELSKQFTFLAGQNNTAVAASLLADPDPLELKCINHGIFKVSPLNIIAIKAKGKTKILYLRKSISPQMSSTKHTTYEVKSGFEELTKKIQPRVSSFLRVHDSYVINLRAYRLLRSGVFKLEGESFEDSVYDPIRKCETDFKFDANVYQKLVKEIEANDEYIANFQPSKVGMEKVNNQMEYFNNKYGNKP